MDKSHLVAFLRLAPCFSSDCKSDSSSGGMKSLLADCVNLQQLSHVPPVLLVYCRHPGTWSAVLHMRWILAVPRVDSHPGGVSIVL